jgi:PBSX family phage terminase large subunit
VAIDLARVTRSLSPQQIRSIVEATSRQNLWEGSIRSGKTIASLLAWLLFISNRPRGGELMMFGKTRDSVSRNLFAPLQDPALFGPLADQIHYTSGAPTATILGETVHVFGANDAKAEPKVRGMTLAGAYGDELTVIPESFYRQILGRASVTGARVYGSTNPDNPAHWLRKGFLLRAHELNLATWHFNIDDNPHLSPDYVADIKAEHQGLWRKRFIEGLWVQSEGAVFDMWDEDVHVLRGPLPPLVALPGVGIDYGTAAAFSAHLLGVQAADPLRGTPARLVLAREYRYDSKLGKRQLTDAEYSKAVREWIGNDRPDWIAVDPSAASFKTQLFHDGVTNVIDAKNDVLDSIRLASSLLATGRLVVHESCEGLIEEVPGYAWDPAASAKGDDRPLKTGDHSIDSGLRYAIYSTRTLWQPYISASYAA